MTEWVMVPKEATEEVLKGMTSSFHHFPMKGEYGRAKSAFVAMLAAAPTEPTEAVMAVVEAAAVAAAELCHPEARPSLASLYRMKRAGVSLQSALAKWRAVMDEKRDSSTERATAQGPYQPGDDVPPATISEKRT